MPGTHKGSTNPSTNDELSCEVALRAHVDKTGLTVGGKSRFLAATDRLLGGIVGIPAAYFEGIRARAEVKNSMLLELARAQASESIKLLEGMSELGKVAAQRLIAEEIGRQLNREAVWAETAKAVEDMQDQTSSQSTDTVNDAKEISEDWFNIFIGYAERASSEQIQHLWGRVLAGQIRSPGSFSPSTLRIMAEIDPDTAKLFQELVAQRINGELLLRPANINQGNILSEWRLLEESGLIQDVNPTSLGSLEFYFNGENGKSVVLTAGSYYLKITFTEQVSRIAFPVIKMTRVGQQIAQILPWHQLPALKAAASVLSDNVGLEVGLIAAQPSAGLQLIPLEIIKSPTTS
ncbi:MAG: DUF2806 domain-containing protein [Proteobacteria bacterium]|nr:DUF2806 domain-containing protein [Pseudomonadota bacterium]